MNFSDIKPFVPPPTLGFRSRKAAQIAAYFALREGGKIEKLKLIKLIYLCERESIAQRGRPMIFDEFYSLKHGPICSNALNGINGVSEKKAWAKYVKLRSDNKNVKAQVDADASLDELSQSDTAILASVWEKCGWMDSSKIREWTHKNCEEYEEVESGRLPISYADISRAVGREDAQDIERRVKEHRSLESSTSK